MTACNWHHWFHAVSSFVFHPSPNMFFFPGNGEMWCWDITPATHFTLHLNPALHTIRRTMSLGSLGFILNFILGDILTVPCISFRRFWGLCFYIRYLITLPTAGSLKGILDICTGWGNGKWENWVQKSRLEAEKLALNPLSTVCTCYVTSLSPICVCVCVCARKWRVEYLPAAHTVKSCELKGMSTCKEKRTQAEGKKRWRGRGCNFNALSSGPMLKPSLHCGSNRK